MATSSGTRRSSQAGPGSARARLRLAAVLALGLLAAAWAIIGLRLLFLPPEGLAGVLAAAAGLIALADAVGYGLSARWVAVQKRWGQFVAIGLVVVNLLLGFTTDMTWVEWSVLAVNALALGLLLGCLPRRRAS